MSKDMDSYEVNFDGLIGPTHNYSGLSHGNLASQSHAAMVSYPKAAALQGIGKMRSLIALGYRQGFFLPQVRPDLGVLRQLGFSGSPLQVLEKVSAEAPHLLSMVYSASSMWAANAATVTPSADTTDNKVHFTAANLVTTVHRAIECQQTTHCLSTVFADTDYFEVHGPITAHPSFGDEGAANHNRLCAAYGDKGVGLFVHGDAAGTRTGSQEHAPTRFPARQMLEASRAVARQHGVIDDSVFLQQNPAAIDGGAFHNDVVAVSNGPVLFYHETAFVSAAANHAFAEIKSQVPNFTPICVPATKVSLDDAIRSYLFNSQLLASPMGEMTEMTLVAPLECQEVASVCDYLQSLSRDDSQPIRDVVFVDVRQSMSNGGGPACLRLRVVLNEAELEAVDQRFIATDPVLDQLEEWVNAFYRDEVSPQDLKDPAFMEESMRALKALEVAIGVPGFYPF
ncbi:MAG: succinylarginine dihydrolase [Candidatus Azotimanducaceae bacterium]|jgi:succinylarginine dihydrolase